MRSITTLAAELVAACKAHDMHPTVYAEMEAALGADHSNDDGDAPTVYEQNPDHLGVCLHCGLPKDFHKREGDMLVCHSLESRPMPL